MATRWSKEELDRLLGRGAIGPSRRDAMLETILAQTRKQAPTQSRWRWVFVGLAALTATATALVLLVPRWSPTVGSPFRSKGAPVLAPTASLECLGGTLDACPVGSLLAIRVSGTRGYVSAWAEPARGGERIWYFSAESESPSVAVDPSSAGILTRAVKIGPEHAAGTYQVELRVTERPMSRVDLLGAPAGAVLLASRSALTVSGP
jgi:hypothetical protein